MTVAEKRKVVEVLLCARNEHGLRIINLADERTETHNAYAAFEDAYEDTEWSNEYWPTCLEAAYRLIESSATLRKEWFGR